MADRTRGKCSVCRYSFRLRKDGTLQVHHLYSGCERCSTACRGSGLLPFDSRIRNPQHEAAALIAEWADCFRRTDTAWRDVYTETELQQVDRALDVLLAAMPDPSRSLFFRLRAEADAELGAFDGAPGHG